MITLALEKSSEIRTIVEALYIAFEHYTELANETTDDKTKIREYRATAKEYYTLWEKLSKSV